MAEELGQQHFEGFMREIMETTLPKEAMMGGVNVEGKCYERARGRHEEFISCMRKVEKKEKKQKSDLLYLTVFTGLCFNNAAAQGGSFEECKEKGKQNFKAFFDKMEKDAQNI